MTHLELQNVSSFEVPWRFLHLQKLEEKLVSKFDGVKEKGKLSRLGTCLVLHQVSAAKDSFLPPIWAVILEDQKQSRLTQHPAPYFQPKISKLTTKDCRPYRKWRLNVNEHKRVMKQGTHIFGNSFLSSSFSSALKANYDTFIICQCLLGQPYRNRHLSWHTHVPKKSL